MTVYKTTTPIKTLSGGGVALGARETAHPSAFTPKLWAALLAEGAIIELEKEKPEFNPEFASMTLKELRDEAKRRGISVTGNKAALLKRVQDD